MEYQRLVKELFTLHLDEDALPSHVHVLQPYHGENQAVVQRIVREFHRNFYADDRPRHLMLGINPGRSGAGSTGLAFTDTKRCEEDLGIPFPGARTHEVSSDFFYRMIGAVGGVEKFYARVYVHAICPLGFTTTGKNGYQVNLNYYDDKRLQEAVLPFIEAWLLTLIDSGMHTDRVVCIGTGKNHEFLVALNKRMGLFGEVIPVEHPRYIMQYKSKHLDEYIQKYVQVFDRL